MPAIFRNTDLLVKLRSLADRGDDMAAALMAMMNGTRWVDITGAAEASDTVRISGQVKDQDSQAVAGVQNIVVESFLEGGATLTAVRLATAAALDACTPFGVAAAHTLTADANGALTVDSVAVADGDRLLVKNQVAGDDNGIYVVTAKGDVGTPFILTRAADFSTSAMAVKGVLVPVTLGTVNTGKTFIHTTAAAITLDTTALTFADFSSPATADLGGMVAGTVGSVKQGSGTSKVWMVTDANGAFNLDIKNVQVGTLLVRATTDNGEVELVLLTFA